MLPEMMIRLAHLQSPIVFGGRAFFIVLTAICLLATFLSMSVAHAHYINK